eukprot:gene5982-6587_t
MKVEALVEDRVRATLRQSFEVSTLQQQQSANIDTTNQTITTEGFLYLMDTLKLKRPFNEIFTERIMQTIDDYQLSKVVHDAYQGIDPYYIRRILKQNQPNRPKVVILGSGWGAHALIKTIDATQYDIQVISPRHFFTFTPMLASSAVGSVEFQSICEPIRNVNPLIDYLEAAATEINFTEQSLQCVSVKCQGTACDIATFDIHYDYLVIAVGATVNTFNIKGVRDHCQFLKQIEDAINLRKAIANSFERANIPNQSEDDIYDALSFVIVGAGPTGVEFTSELRDWIEVEGRKYYGHLLKYVRITLVEAGETILPVFDKSLQEEALKKLTERATALVKDGYIPHEITHIKLRCGVKEVGDKVITFSNGEKLNYGFCVWAAGNGPVPFVLGAINKIPEQKDLQSKAKGRLVTDSWLRVKGVRNVLAIGDCSIDLDSPLPATAQVASQQGAYLGRLFSKGFNLSADPSVAPYRIRSLDGVTQSIIRTSSSSSSPPSSISEVNVDNQEEQSNVMMESVLSRYSDNADQTIAATITSSLIHQHPPRSPPNIRFISDKVGLGQLALSVENEKYDVDYAKPFQFLNLGILAYIGASQALAQIALDQKSFRGTGQVGFLLWRGIYWFKQVSWRNRALITLDWIKARLFGRTLGA